MFGVKRKSTLVGLAFLMFMGIAVYFRLWAIDYNISIDDSELLREAMDESAEWRLKYDKEVDRMNRCLKELQVVCILLQFSLSTFQSE
ncbi:transmembrane protein, putative [Medicago truncatula]|uniref:Transmembrane protein, putative n=1 Tax=Medicago truncatula TaxID=3880 RepID=A0A072VVW5_MEDTR|nr:transmembrane protein, putative [Medicago truncatula]